MDPSDPRGLVVVISGPSGVGKGSVHAGLHGLLADLVTSVSVTTRAPRPGEVDGVAYHFVDRTAFEAMVERGELLEWAEYAGNRYGTPRGPVDDVVAAGQVALLEVEVQGALQVRAARPDAMLVLLVPPSLEELERRLRDRGTEDEVTVQARLEVARSEMGASERFDHIVVNDDLAGATAEVARLIDRARHGFGA
jgi:guanylate kinase